jgi:putative ABC transport system ATP-binding protein
MKRIQAQHISKQYGKGDSAVSALKEVTFTIEAGEFVAIMGESGSGKSTLLSIVGTLNRPTSGRMMVDDVDVYALGQDQRADFRRESIGFVFQNFNLLPYLTLAENVMLPLATVREKKAKKRSMALDALMQVGLVQKAERLPSQISGGEQERVAIARAIVGRPPIILADEPTGNLDTKTGKEIMGIINTLNADGMTIIMVTHNPDYAAYANRVLRVADGLLTQQPRVSRGGRGARIVGAAAMFGTM